MYLFGREKEFCSYAFPTDCTVNDAHSSEHKPAVTLLPKNTITVHAVILLAIP